MALKQRDRLLVVCRCCAQSWLINQKCFFLVLCRVLRREKKSCKTLIHKTWLQRVWATRRETQKMCNKSHIYFIPDFSWFLKKYNLRLNKVDTWLNSEHEKEKKILLLDWFFFCRNTIKSWLLHLGKGGKNTENIPKSNKTMMCCKSLQQTLKKALQIYQ